MGGEMGDACNIIQLYAGRCPPPPVPRHNEHVEELNHPCMSPDLSSVITSWIHHGSRLFHGPQMVASELHVMNLPLVSYACHWMM